MKKILRIIIGLLIIIPFFKVNALSCLSSEIDINKVDNFTCSEVDGTTLKFTDNTSGEDYTSYFTYTVNDNSALISIDKNIKLDAAFPNRFIKVTDASKEAIINVKNPSYTTTKATSTTKDANTKEIIVTLDPNDGTGSTNKTCNIVAGNNTCTVTLPKLETDGFNGWGTAATCKEGNTGAIRVEKDITYYACYEKNENTNTNKSIALETLELINKDTNEKIEFGTFSRKKTEYKFKVLYDVENIEVKATASNDIKVEITGNENLKVGENVVLVKLTNDNNETNEYKLIVTRLKMGETISNVHYLKSLVIGGYKINFNKETFKYSLTIAKDINKLELTAKPENDDDTVEITNNENLTNGSVIKITVKGEDEEETIYTINITKEKSSNLVFYIIGSIIALLIILLIILIIIKSKRKKNQNVNGPQNIVKDNNNVEVLNI